MMIRCLVLAASLACSLPAVARLSSDDATPPRGLPATLAGLGHAGLELAAGWYLPGANAGLQPEQAAQVAAIRTLHSDAGRGSISAMLRLGTLYDSAGDPVGARAWFLKAGQAGSSAGMFQAARLFLREADPADRAQGRSWLEKAAGMGERRAIGLLGICKLIGKGGFEPDPVNGARLARSAAEQGDGDAAVALSAAYRGGIGVPASPKQEAAWGERAARLGQDYAQMLAAERRLAVGDPAGALFWASVARRSAPPEFATRLQAVWDAARSRTTTVQQSEQLRRAAAWHPEQAR